MIRILACPGGLVNNFLMSLVSQENRATINIEMDTIGSSQFTQRNPVTQRSHTRQKAWQITLPLLLGVIVALVFAILAGLAQAGDASRWADIALIFLLIPVMVVTLLFLAFFAALVYLMLRLLRIVPPFALKVQDVFAQIEQRVRIGANLTVEPFLRVQSWLAALRVLRREL